MDDTVAKPFHNPPCLYPDEILSQYKLLEPAEYVTVRGQVIDLRPFEDKVVYGDLKGREGVISFRCPPDRCPTEKHQNVILGGFLTVKTSRIHQGLDVELRGEMVGQWKGMQSTPSDIIIPERIHQVKTSLACYIREAPSHLDSLLVIGTRRGLHDCRQASGISLNGEVVNVSDVNLFIADAKKAIETHQPKAVAIVRGGAEGNRTMEIWNSAKLIDQLLKTKRLIYSAIGHADGYVFLDQYADQGFISPVDLGHGLRDALRMREHDAEIFRKTCELEQENADYARKIQDLNVEHREAVSTIQASHANELEQKLARKDEVLEKQRSKTRFFTWMTGLLSLGIGVFTSVVFFKEQIVGWLSS